MSRITVNGDERVVDAEATVAKLLADLGLQDRKVAVERNRAIVKRGDWDTTRIADGDRFEILHFVGGG